MSPFSICCISKVLLIKKYVVQKEQKGCFPHCKCTQHYPARWVKHQLAIQALCCAPPWPTPATCNQFSASVIHDVWIWLVSQRSKLPLIMAAAVEGLHCSDIAGLNQIEIAAICFMSRCLLLPGLTAWCLADRKSHPMHFNMSLLQAQVSEVLLNIILGDV